MKDLAESHQGPPTRCIHNFAPKAESSLYNPKYHQERGLTHFDKG